MISVITPVFNGEFFLVKNIESVLSQPEVSEHILVDDGSTDKSWEIIQYFAKSDTRVIALRHYDRKNHGRSKTKNLGIKAATNKWIGFLDVDDFYLNRRFVNDFKLLDDKNVDGVYNAIGIHFYDNYKGDKNIVHKLTTLKSIILPDQLFEKMSPIGNQGWFSGDGLLIKKESLVNVGLFNEKLEVTEDTELWIKLSLKYNLVPGEISEPVAIRGVHDSNVFLNEDLYFKTRLLMYQNVLVWACRNEIINTRLNMLADKYLSYLSYFSGNNFMVFCKYWIQGATFAPKLFCFKSYIIPFFKYNNRNMRRIVNSIFIKMKN